MKSFSNCKVAVCFVGQTRTFEYCADSIKSLFSSDRGNEYYFFGHAWDTNTWKTKPEDKIIMIEERIEDIIDLERRLRNSFNFEKLIVEKEIYRPQSWASVFYSTMRSNFLKQQYEAENNMMFDLVIKARYDICYANNGLKFENYFNYDIGEKTLYSDFGHMNLEFFLPNPDDVLYYGSSLTMDLVDSLYNQLSTGSFNKLMGTNVDNLVYKRVGPGILIYKWATLKNILFRHNIIPYSVYRKQAIGLDSRTQWDEIRNISHSVF